VEQIYEVRSGGAPMNSHIALKVLDMFKNLAPSPGDYHLTNREKEILKYLVDGLAKKEISAKLFISYHTVDNHVRNIYEKLEVHSSSGAVAKALKENLL
jgi:DNA-binding NarL/FixJ family response regulator